LEYLYYYTMSLSQNLQNILDETLQSFLTMDLSSNLMEQLNRISPNLINSTSTSTSTNTNTRLERTIPIPIHETPNEENENESLPDLIPIEEPESMPSSRVIERQREPIDDTARRIRLWSNVLLDYHNQINTYQENMRAVFNITEHLLPTTETRSRYSAPNNNNNTSSLWQSLFQNPAYVLEFDTANIWNRNTNTNTNTNTRQTPLRNIPTAFQIQTATSLFSYNSQENPLTVTICPITLEEFIEDEILMRINGCGHIFKATALHRWFERNHKCPSCRYDILRAAFSLPSTSTS